MNPSLNDGARSGSHNGDGHQGNHNGDGDRNHGHHHHDHDDGPWIFSWYGYPGWGWYPWYPYYSYYPYPYVIDPGFYDWSYSSDSAYAPASGYGQAPPDANYRAQPYTPQDPEPPQPTPESAPRQPYSPQSDADLTRSSSSEPVPPVTVIFKNGRPPEQFQNYMLSARFLTNLDPQHYEQIPVDQIDIAATVHTNSMRGVQFVVPSASN